MANANLPRGLIPVRHRNGAPYNGAFHTYYVPASYGTALFRGDPVVVVTDSSDANGIQTVARTAAGGGAYSIGVCLGAITGGSPPITQLAHDNQHHVASTAGYVAVADDPDLLFEVQEDSVGGVMTVGAVGRNADFVAGTGVAATGYSGFMLDSSTLNTTNTLQLRIVAPVDRIDNDPTLDYAKWLVSFNLHSLRNLTGV